MINSIKCYECNNCTKITDNIPVLSQCRRCLVNKTQTGIIRSCIQSCPLITLRECRQNSVKCCKKDLCNFANLLVSNNMYITSVVPLMMIRCIKLFEKL
uniref:Uncharacterized protein n=1 Tax=Schistosoma mansoni TaxID=6183 RepID=A0A5K4FCU1_SCHMA